MSGVTLNNVIKRYGEAQVIHGVDLEIDNGEATLTREVEGGHTTLRGKLPLALGAQKGLNEPRYASLPNIMKAKKKQLDVYTPDDLGVAVTSHITLVKVQPPAERQAGIEAAAAAEANEEASTARTSSLTRVGSSWAGLQRANCIKGRRKSRFKHRRCSVKVPNRTFWTNCNLRKVTRKRDDHADVTNPVISLHRP